MESSVKMTNNNDNIDNSTIMDGVSKITLEEETLDDFEKTITPKKLDSMVTMAPKSSTPNQSDWWRKTREDYLNMSPIINPHEDLESTQEIMEALSEACGEGSTESVKKPSIFDIDDPPPTTTNAFCSKPKLDPTSIHEFGDIFMTDGIEKPSSTPQTHQGAASYGVNQEIPDEIDIVDNNYGMTGEHQPIGQPIPVLQVNPSQTRNNVLVQSTMYNGTNNDRAKGLAAVLGMVDHVDKDLIKRLEPHAGKINVFLRSLLENRDLDQSLNYTKKMWKKSKKRRNYQNYRQNESRSREENSSPVLLSVCPVNGLNKSWKRRLQRERQLDDQLKDLTERLESTKKTMRLMGYDTA